MCLTATAGPRGAPEPGGAGAPETARAPGAAGGRRLLLVSLALAVFMGRLDIYIVAIALPTVAREFHATASAVSWVTVGYLLFNTGSMLFIGRVANRSGPRRVFLAGYAVFVAGALLATFSPSLGLLIAARCIQGLGGAIIVVMTYGVVTRLLPVSRMGSTFGILATAGALGVAVGSPLGGLLTATLSWRWVFFVNVPVGIAAMVVARRALPESARPGDNAETAGTTTEARDGTPGRGRPDYAGGLLSFAALGALVLFLDQGQTRGWVSPFTMVLLAATAAAAVLFVWQESRAADPLLAPALLRDRRLRLAAAASVCGLILMGGNALLMPFFLQLGKGLSPALAGLLMMTYSLAFMALSPFAGRLADRFAPQSVAAVAMSIGAGGCVVLALTAGAPGYVPATGFLLALAVTYALFISANSKQVLQAPPAEYRSAGPALLGALNNLSLLLGASLFKAVYSSLGEIPDTAAGTASGSSGATAGATAWTGGWWIPGFGAAYLVGAVACGAALVLCLVARSHVGGRTTMGSRTTTAGHATTGRGTIAGCSPAASRPM